MDASPPLGEPTPAPTAPLTGSQLVGLLRVGDAEDSRAPYARVLSIGAKPLAAPTTAGLHLPLSDELDADLLSMLPPALAFLIASSSTSTLVHCAYGMSRSVAVAMAHLMVSGGLTLDEAGALVLDARPGAHPNEGFLQQLALLDRALQPGAPLAAGCASAAICAPKPAARLHAAACRRRELGLGCSGFDRLPGTVPIFIAGPRAWPPPQVSPDAAAALRARAEAGIARAVALAAGGGAPEPLVWLRQQPAGGAGSWYCCGRCKAHLFSTVHVLADGPLAALRASPAVAALRASPEGSWGAGGRGAPAPPPPAEADGELAVLVEPLGWMARPYMGDAAGGSDDGGSPGPPMYATLPTTEELDALAQEDGGKLACPAPRCGAKLGAWSWEGAWRVFDAASRGSAEVIGAPAFHIPMSRLVRRPIRQEGGGGAGGGAVA